MDIEQILPNNLKHIVVDIDENVDFYYIYSTRMLKEKCLIQYVWDIPAKANKLSKVGIFLNVVTYTVEESLTAAIYYRKPYPSPIVLRSLIVELSNYLDEKLSSGAPIREILSAVSMGVLSNCDQRIKKRRESKYNFDRHAIDRALLLSSLT